MAPTVTTEPAEWRSVDRTERVNYSDRPADAPVRSVRVAHLVRGDHTLCGRRSDGPGWRPADAHTRRCPACGDVGPDRYIHRDVTAAAGITYRQLDHWCRKGYLRTANDTGSGSQRAFTRTELDVARLMGVLVAVGVHPAAAETVARGGLLAPGVRVVIDDPAVSAA